MVSASAPARIALLGHPCGAGLFSDNVGGFGGRTIALALSRYRAEVSLEHADGIEIVPLDIDQPRWSSIADLTRDVDRRGYIDAVSLITATIRTLADLVDSVADRGVDQLGFRLRYHSTIPTGVGLAESSALVVATLGALTEMIDLEISASVLATVAHRVETQQLGMVAELDDAVVQSHSLRAGRDVKHGPLLAMDFGVEEIDGRFGVTFGDYSELPGSGLPPMYLAFRRDQVLGDSEKSLPSESGRPGDLYRRLRRSKGPGHGQTREVLQQLTAVAAEGEAALRWRNGSRFVELLSQDLRLRRLLAPLTITQERLLDVATAAESAVTVASSLAGPLVGASVVGVYEDPEHLAQITLDFEAVGAEVVPIDAPPDPDPKPNPADGDGQESDLDQDPDTVIPFDPAERGIDPDGAA